MPGIEMPKYVAIELCTDDLFARQKKISIHINTSFGEETINME